MEKAEAGFMETAEYLEEKQSLVGLHASFTVSDEMLKNAVGLQNIIIQAFIFMLLKLKAIRSIVFSPME